MLTPKELAAEAEQVRRHRLPFRLIITGSRDWVDRPTIEQQITLATLGHYPDEVVIVHGNARGADTIAAAIATERGMVSEPHPADWRAHGKAAGPIRNAEMVACGADAALAFPIGPSPGTRGCIDLITAAKIPLVITEGTL